MRRRSSLVVVALLSVGGLAPPAVRAQPPTMERVTFDEAVRRAMAANPSVKEAAQAILRAEGLLQQAHSATRPIVNGGVSNLLIDGPRGFVGTVTQPRNQVMFSADLTYPLLASAQWAATTQARDQIEVATLSTSEARRQIGIATGQAYLEVITQVRQVDVIIRAQEAARTHLDYAVRRLQLGAGSRLNQLRAAQEVTSDDARLENARLLVRRAQEALGVLMAVDGPVDAAGEPIFNVPTDPVSMSESTWMPARADVKLFTASQRAAERVVHDSNLDKYPTLNASFHPQLITPAGAFAPPRTWTLAFTFSQSVFDGGQRAGALQVRQANAESSRQALTSLQIQARSEVRLAEETVRSLERTLASVQEAANQAREVLSITNTAFEAGANTNLEVIDAQRSARDADSTVELAQDALRRARLDFLTALGRFPQ